MNKREPFIKPTGVLHFFAARLFSVLPGKLIPFHGCGAARDQLFWLSPEISTYMPAAVSKMSRIFSRCPSAGGEKAEPDDIMGDCTIFGNTILSFLSK